MIKIHYPSPIGVIEIVGTNQAIISILYTNLEKPEHLLNKSDPKVIHDCCLQLDEYFKGERTEFFIPYIIKGTDFQKDVWQALTKISYGQTTSYGDIAKRINRDKAVRAVGSANGKNQLNIIIPCHRIIGKNGKLTGYGGGLQRKKWLLNHEKSNITHSICKNGIK